jgi:hypothetical protein
MRRRGDDPRRGRRMSGIGRGQFGLARRWEIEQAEADEHLLGDHGRSAIAVITTDELRFDQSIRCQVGNMIAPRLDTGRQAITPTTFAHGEPAWQELWRRGPARPRRRRLLHQPIAPDRCTPRASRTSKRTETNALRRPFVRRCALCPGPVSEDGPQPPDRPVSKAGVSRCSWCLRRARVARLAWRLRYKSEYRPSHYR